MWISCLKKTLEPQSSLIASVEKGQAGAEKL